MVLAGLWTIGVLRGQLEHPIMTLEMRETERVFSHSEQMKFALK